MATRVIEEIDSDTEVVHHDHGGNNTGLVIGLVVILLIALLVIFYGLPYLRGIGTTNVNVPESVDVNVNSTAK